MKTYQDILSESLFLDDHLDHEGQAKHHEDMRLKHDKTSVSHYRRGQERAAAGDHGGAEHHWDISDAHRRASEHHTRLRDVHRELKILKK